MSNDDDATQRRTQYFQDKRMREAADTAQADRRGEFPQGGIDFGMHSFKRHISIGVDGGQATIFLTAEQAQELIERLLEPGTVEQIKTWAQETREERAEWEELKYRSAMGEPIQHPNNAGEGGEGGTSDPETK